MSGRRTDRRHHSYTKFFTVKMNVLWTQILTHLFWVCRYTVFQWKDLHDLRALGGPCVDGDGATSTDDVDDLLPRLPREDSSESSGCDSITLYSVEEYLRQLVPPNRRIVTFEDDLDFR